MYNSQRLSKLNAQKADLAKKLTELRDKTNAQDGKLTDTQNIEWQTILSQGNELDKQIQTERDYLEFQASLEVLPKEEAETVINPQQKPKSKQLFSSFGEQIQAIAHAFKGGNVDSRLMEINAAATGAATSPLQDGGFLIQTQFSDEIWRMTNETSQLASRCMKITLGDGFNAIEIPVLKDANRTDGNRFGGVAVYRAGEASAVDYTKIKFNKIRMESSKLMALTAFTHELLRDAAAVESITTQAVSEEFAVVLDEEIFDGDGGQGRCLGYINSGSLISVAKETGQAAASIVPQNIVKMVARSHPRFRPNMVWLVNPDIDPQLHLMTLPIGTAGIPVYLPPSGLHASPDGMLYGKPIVYVETAETLGTLGDLTLVDLNQYALIQKEGLRVAKSEHVLFTSDQLVIRFTMEVNGQPKYDEAITPKKGSNTLSPFIALAARA